MIGLFAATAALLVILLNIAYKDYQEMAIYDRDIAAGLIAAFWGQYFYGDMADAVAGCLYNGLLFFAYYWAVRYITKAENFGFGDVLLAFLTGAVLGARGALFLQTIGNLVIVAVGAAFYLLERGKRKLIPLAPFYVAITLSYILFRPAADRLLYKIAGG